VAARHGRIKRLAAEPKCPQLLVGSVVFMGAGWRSSRSVAGGHGFWLSPPSHAECPLFGPEYGQRSESCTLSRHSDCPWLGAVHNSKPCTFPVSLTHNAKSRQAMALIGIKDVLQGTTTFDRTIMNPRGTLYWIPATSDGPESGIVLACPQGINPYDAGYRRNWSDLMARPLLGKICVQR
jgi:hypothetical protein